MPKNNLLSTPLLFCLLLAFCSPSPLFAAQPADSPARLAVIGVSNETDSEEFNDLLIARGIANLVAQSLYDTGSYQPVEEKAEIRSRINDLVRRHTVEAPEIVEDIGRMEEIRKELNCRAIAWAVVKDLKKSRSRSMFGPFSSAKTTITVTVEVFLREQGHQPRSHQGQGRGVTRAKGVVFQIRDDRIAFDETTAGQAVQQAVREAVAKFTTE